MKQFFSLGLALCLSTSLLHAHDQEQALYQFQGKTHSSKDLSPALQQAAYEIQHQAYENLQKVVEAQILEDYARAEAKKKGITFEQYEEKNFKGKKATEKDAKTWFEANKARLGGREFDSLKTDILQLLQSQEDEKVRFAMLTKIKADGKFQVMFSEPLAPVVKINYAGYPTKGKADAKVTIVEFADYKCPHCRDASKALKSVVDKYKDKVQFVYLDFPIDRSGVSKKVAIGAVCADHQKKFWEYHYLAFGDSAPLTADSATDFAKKLKLDMKAFETCLAAAETTKKVDLAKSEGERIGIDGTPAIFFNGRKIYGHSEKLLEDALKKLL